MKIGDRYVVRCIKKPVGYSKPDHPVYTFHPLDKFEAGDYVDIVDLNGPTEASPEGDWPPVRGMYCPVKDLTEAFVFTVLTGHYERTVEALGDETAEYASGYFGDLISEFECSHPEFFEIVPVKVVPVVL